MQNFIYDSERKSMITRGLDYHNHNTHFKETIWTIRSNTNWGFNSALTDWNTLTAEMRCLPYNTFRISWLIKNFKSQQQVPGFFLLQFS